MIIKESKKVWWGYIPSLSLSFFLCAYEAKLGSFGSWCFCLNCLQDKVVESFYPKSNEWKYSDLVGKKKDHCFVNYIWYCCTCCRLLGIFLNKTAVKITKRHLNHKKDIVMCWGTKVQLKRILSGLYCDGSLKKKKITLTVAKKWTTYEQGNLYWYYLLWLVFNNTYAN